MAKRRKVLFSYGQSGKYQLIITDAPKEAIEKWCVLYLLDQENGEKNEPFYSLKAKYFVKELLEYEWEEDMDVIGIIGYDETYDYSSFEPIIEKVQDSPRFVGNLNDVSVDELITFLERYKGTGKKLSVMGTSIFNVFDDGKYIILDEEDLSSERFDWLELTLPDGKSITAPLCVDITPQGFLDEQENELWKLLLSYMQKFGILAQKPDEPDWATVKEVQEKILEVFEKAGVKFNV